MSALVFSLRALVIEDCARVADQQSRPAVARLLRRADLSREDLTAASVDLRARNAVAAALALLGTDTFGADRGAAELLADECGLELDAWIAATLDEQRATLAPEVSL